MIPENLRTVVYVVTPIFLLVLYEGQSFSYLGSPTLGVSSVISTATILSDGFYPAEKEFPGVPWIKVETTGLLETVVMSWDNHRTLSLDLLYIYYMYRYKGILK